MAGILLLFSGGYLRAALRDWRAAADIQNTKKRRFGNFRTIETLNRTAPFKTLQKAFKRQKQSMSGSPSPGLFRLCYLAVYPINYFFFHFIRGYGSEKTKPLVYFVENFPVFNVFFSIRFNVFVFCVDKSSYLAGDVIIMQSE